VENSRYQILPAKSLMGKALAREQLGGAVAVISKTKKRSIHSYYEHVHMKKRYAALIIGAILPICVVTSFVFAFLYQVQAQKVFQVTISCFGERFHTYIWTVNIQQLSHEELHPEHDSQWEEIANETGDEEMDYWQATVIINERSGGPFPGSASHVTSDGRAQQTFGTGPQPTNITIIWDGGREVFLFRPSPIFSE